MGNAELCMKSKMQVCTELLKTQIQIPYDISGH